MSYKCLLYDVKDQIATLTLNRPERLNALGDTLRDDLHDAIVRSAASPEVRVMVITGAGRGFCSGGDVKNMNERDRAGQQSYTLHERVAPQRDQTLLVMRDSPKPIIAAVNGVAAGAGFNLALGCDMRIASTTAKFTRCGTCAAIAALRFAASHKVAWAAWCVPITSGSMSWTDRC